MSEESGFQMALHSEGEIDVIALAGVLDEDSAERLRIFGDLVLEQRTGSGAALVDLTQVPYVDSDGFGALIHLQKRFTEAGRPLALVGCQEPVRLTLELTRLEVLLPSYATLADFRSTLPGAPRDASARRAAGRRGPTLRGS